MSDYAYEQEDEFEEHIFGEEDKRRERDGTEPENYDDYFDNSRSEVAEDNQDLLIGEWRVNEETPDDVGLSAEIIVVITSLGFHRRRFFMSLQAVNFLNCKSVPYFVVDANREVSAGANLDDDKLLKAWEQQSLLSQETADSTAGVRFAIPQILIDGVSIGDSITLQDLEEDGDLDWILAKQKCPRCLSSREQDAAACVDCDARFVSLIDEGLMSSRRVQRMFRGQLCFEEFVSVTNCNFQMMKEQAERSDSIIGHAQVFQ